MSKNLEKYDPRIPDEAPFNRILNKYFMRPHETAEAQLARLIDSSKSFKYESTLFYGVRSGNIKYGDPRISRAPVGSEWWDMPWLKEPQIHRKKKKDHGHMLKILNGFKSLFASIKANGFIVNDFDSRVRSDKLTCEGEVCYINVDANKRMGILGYLVESGQLKIDIIPVKIARSASSYHCGWMSDDKANLLFSHPFEVLNGNV